MFVSLERRKNYKNICHKLYVNKLKKGGDITIIKFVYTEKRRFRSNLSINRSGAIYLLTDEIGKNNRLRLIIFFF